MLKWTVDKDANGFDPDDLSSPTCLIAIMNEVELYIR